MNAISYTEARENLAKTIQHVCRDHDLIIITRKREDSGVMISLEDYESLTETAYLLKSPQKRRPAACGYRRTGARQGNRTGSG